MSLCLFLHLAVGKLNTCTVSKCNATVQMISVNLFVNDWEQATAHPSPTGSSTQTSPRKRNNSPAPEGSDGPAIAYAAVLLLCSQQAAGFRFGSRQLAT